MSDAATLDAAAAALAEQAGALPGLLDRAVARSGVDVWQGPAQEHLSDELMRLRGVLRTASGELYDVAARLRADAAALRAAEEPVHAGPRGVL